MAAGSWVGPGDSCPAGGLEHEAPALLVAPGLLPPGGAPQLSLTPPGQSGGAGRKGVWFQKDCRVTRLLATVEEVKIQEVKPSDGHIFKLLSP